MSLIRLRRTPQDLRQWEEFHLQHYIDHKIILGVVAKNAGQTLLMPPIWPVPDNRLTTRLAKWHQDLHTQMNELSKVAGVDMSRATLSTKDGRDDFVNTNYREHLIFHQVIGVPT